MYNKSLLFVNDIAISLKNNSQAELPIDKFIEIFQIVNKEFDFLTRESIIDIFRRNFVVYNKNTNDNNSITISNNKKDTYMINLDSFLNFFVKKYFFKIKIVEYLEITLNSLINIIGNIEKKIMKLFEAVDYKRQGYIYVREFEEIMTKLLDSAENKWKIYEYFTKACGSQDKEFLTKEEFIIFCLNTREIFFILFNLNEIRR